MAWQYKTHTIPGNLHDAAVYLTENHPNWDVVEAERVGHYTLILYRIRIEDDITKSM